MWRLTEEAIREGVKSTTRYRSKQPNKRGNRSQQPLPQRQASGAKGGQAARRSAKTRKFGRMNEAYRSEPYLSRSVPASLAPHFENTDYAFSQQNSPYYISDTETSYGPIHEEFGSTLGLYGLDMIPARSYSASPLSREVCHDSAYVLYPDPSAPLFSNSPSPSADDPLTPPSPGIEWDMDMNGLPGGPYIFGDEQATEYHELMQ